MTVSELIEDRHFFLTLDKLITKAKVETRPDAVAAPLGDGRKYVVAGDLRIEIADP